MDVSEAFSLCWRTLWIGQWFTELFCCPLPAEARRVIMRPEGKQANTEQNYLGGWGPSNVTCSGSCHQILIRLRGHTLDMPRKISWEAQGIPRHGSGDPLRDRLGSWWKMMNFMIRGRELTQNWRFRSIFAVLTHIVDSAMIHRALLLSFTSWSSKSNNATREKAGNERAKLFMATGVFFCHVLRIQTFVCNEIAREHRRYTKEDFLRTSGNLMSQIWRSTGWSSKNS